MPEDSYKPLISIIVITYNSSKFVLDTLESAKAQTYENLELIISDDHSTDGTVDICNKWLEDNKNRFASTALLSVDTNTGIPANLNRAISISRGLWIKYIAGDDLLAENCIADLLFYINTLHEDIQILSSDIIMFSGDLISNGKIKKNPYVQYFNKECSAQDQYKKLLR